MKEKSDSLLSGSSALLRGENGQDHGQDHGQGSRQESRAWKNIIAVIAENWRDLRKMLAGDRLRIRIQFLAVYAILGTVSAGMTVLNVITGWTALTWGTGIFSFACLVNTVLCLLSEKTERLAQLLFAAEIVILFTFFAVCGEPEGFSVIWAVLLPSCGMLLYKLRTGIILNLTQLGILVLLFETETGRSFLLYEYTESFLQRFPLLFLAFLFVGTFFEYIRHNTQNELAESRAEFAYLYNHDALTGLLNRYGFNENMAALRGTVQGRRLAFAICDVDSFKAINDTYGHQQGDEVLKKLSSLIRETVGGAGAACRWGGEEFSILFYEEAGAAEICGRILERCRAEEYRSGDRVFHATVSIGLIGFPEPAMDNISEIITAADQNLYQAKLSGKDRLVSGLLEEDRAAAAAGRENGEQETQIH